MSEEREISLSKGRQVSLTKGLSKLRVSVEWKPNTRSRNSNQDFDIDLIVVETQALSDGRYRCLSPDHLVFYGSYETTTDGKFTDPQGAVVHSGDDRTGDGDGEECEIIPKKLDSGVTDIFFIINIYEGAQRNQTFEMIKGAEVKVYEDGKDVPKLVYRLDEDTDFKRGTIMTLGSLTREERNKFKFSAIGESGNQSLFQVLTKYGLKFKEDNI